MNFPQELSLSVLLPPRERFGYVDEDRERTHAEEQAVISLAKKAHQMGGQFAGWIRFTEIEGMDAFDMRRLDARVWVIPRER